MKSLADDADTRFRRRTSYQVKRKRDATKRIDEDVFAVMPPLERYLGVSEDVRRKLFYKIFRPGAVVVGQISSVSGSGVDVAVLALERPYTREIWDLNIKGRIPFRRLVQLSPEPPFGYSENDFVRCRMTSIAETGTVFLGMKGISVPRAEHENLPLGLISGDDLPMSYWRSRYGSDGVGYDELLRRIPELSNAKSVDVLLQKFGLKARKSYSFMSFFRRKYEAFAEQRVEAGVEFLSAGRPEEALACLNEAIEIHPRCFVAHLSRGTVFASQSRHLDAIREFKNALRLDPDSTDARRFLAVSFAARAREFLDKDCKFEALAMYKECLDARPDDEEALEAVARLSGASGRPSSVVDVEVVELDGPGSPPSSSCDGFVEGYHPACHETGSMDGNASDGGRDSVDDASLSFASGGSSPSASRKPSPDRVFADFPKSEPRLSVGPVSVAAAVAEPSVSLSRRLEALIDDGDNGNDETTPEGRPKRQMSAYRSARSYRKFTALKERSKLGRILAQIKKLEETKKNKVRLRLFQKGKNHFSLSGLTTSVTTPALNFVFRRFQAQARVVRMGVGKCDVHFKGEEVDHFALAQHLSDSLKVQVLPPYATPREAEADVDVGAPDKSVAPPSLASLPRAPAALPVPVAPVVPLIDLTAQPPPARRPPGVPSLLELSVTLPPVAPSLFGCPPIPAPMARFHPCRIPQEFGYGPAVPMMYPPPNFALPAGPVLVGIRLNAAGIGLEASVHRGGPRMHEGPPSLFSGFPNSFEREANPPSRSRKCSLKLFQNSDLDFSLFGLDESVKSEDLYRICESFQTIKNTVRSGVSKYTVFFDGAGVDLFALAGHLSEALRTSINLPKEGIDFHPSNADAVALCAGNSDTVDSSSVNWSGGTPASRGQSETRPFFHIALPRRPLVGGEVPPPEADFTPVSEYY